jgi:DNA-binding transcriptional MerR regulator
MSHRFLTVSELAAVVADRQFGDDPDTVHRQIRHWTTLGALAPSGARFTGTGHARVYPSETAYRAALLVRLAAHGLSISGLKAVSDTLDSKILPDPEYHRLWQAAIGGSEPVDFGYRVLYYPGSTEVYQGAAFLLPRDGELPPGQPRIWALPTTWLDLTDLFGRVTKRLSRAR